MKLRKIFGILFISTLLLIAATSCSQEHVHSFSEWESVIEPTCTAFGLQKKSCECGQVEYNTVDALAHTPVTDTAIEATCTAPGKTEGSHCDTCGAIITPQSVTLPIGHSYGEAVVLEDALCDHSGTKRYSCTNGDCAYYYNEIYDLPELSSSEIYAGAIQYTGVIRTFDHLGEPMFEAAAFVISADGVIVTSNYKTDNAFSATFTLGENTYDVTDVLAYSESASIAVLRVNATDLPFATLCMKGHAAGETVYSVGTPSGLADSISKGVISNNERFMNEVKCIQHDADVNAGYAGGPLVNAYGEVIGLNFGYYGDDKLSLAIDIARLETLDYSNPMSFEEYFAINYTPVEQLDAWINNFNNASNNDGLGYVVEGKGFYYVLGYNLIDKYSFVEGYWNKGDSYHLYVRVIFNNNDGTYQYNAALVERNAEYVNGERTNEIMGFINAETFDSSTVLEYDTYYGKYWTESDLMALYSSAVCEVLEFFSYCLDTYFFTITIEDFGFTSFSCERDEDALVKLQEFIKANGAYEQLTDSYVLWGNAQVGTDTMNFNISHHLETGNTVVSVHYILASGTTYSAYLTLNGDDNGNRFDFMYSTDDENGFVIHNVAWGYLDAATLTSMSKLTCYEFDGMNEYEDALLEDYMMFLDYIIGLLNRSVMPLVEPSLTVEDLGFYFYFG